MGLFSRKKLDFEDETPEAPPEAPAAVEAKTPAEETATVEEVGEPEPEEPEPAQVPLAYGIDDAIKLMRTLPQAEMRVVMEVVKKTLESTNISVGEIVEDARQKTERIQDRILELEGETAELQRQIALRNNEIDTLNLDLEETGQVMRNLQLVDDEATEQEGEATETPPAEPEADAD